MIQPASAGLQVGKVAGPLLAAACGCVAGFKLIAGGTVKGVLPGAPGVKASGRRLDLERPHQPVDPSAAARDSLLAQGLMDSGCAIGTPVALMEFGNRRFQNFILLLMTARWSGQPCVKAAARHLEDSTQSFDAESISVLLDKRKNQ